MNKINYKLKSQKSLQYSNTLFIFKPIPFLLLHDFPLHQNIESYLLSSYYTHYICIEFSWLPKALRNWMCRRIPFHQMLGFQYEEAAIILPPLLSTVSSLRAKVMYDVSPLHIEVCSIVESMYYYSKPPGSIDM